MLILGIVLIPLGLVVGLIMGKISVKAQNRNAFELAAMIGGLISGIGLIIVLGDGFHAKPLFWR